MTHEYISPSRGTLITAGLTFYEEKHEYFYNGKQLPGITGKVSKRLRKNFDSTFVEEGRAQGSHVHSAIEEYIRTGKIVSVHPAVRWAVNELQGFEEAGHTLYSEVLISDFKKYASAIDILCILKDGSVYIFDTKAGEFNREYVAWQLGVYKYFLESTTELRVKRCYCMSTKYQDFYPIPVRSEADIKGLLY